MAKELARVKEETQRAVETAEAFAKKESNRLHSAEARFNRLLESERKAADACIFDVGAQLQEAWLQHKAQVRTLNFQLREALQRAERTEKEAGGRIMEVQDAAKQKIEETEDCRRQSIEVNRRQSHEQAAITIDRALRSQRDAPAKMGCGVEQHTRQTHLLGHYATCDSNNRWALPALSKVDANQIKTWNCSSDVLF